MFIYRVVTYFILLYIYLMIYLWYAPRDSIYIYQLSGKYTYNGERDTLDRVNIHPI